MVSSLPHFEYRQQSSEENQQLWELAEGIPLGLAKSLGRKVPELEQPGLCSPTPTLWAHWVVASQPVPGSRTHMAPLPCPTHIPAPLPVLPGSPAPPVYLEGQTVLFLKSKSSLSILSNAAPPGSPPDPHPELAGPAPSSQLHISAPTHSTLFHDPELSFSPSL